MSVKYSRSSVQHEYFSPRKLPTLQYSVCEIIDYSISCIIGSAFLQFKKQSSVQPCLDVANGDGLHFHGNKLSVSLAVSKKQAQEFKGQDTRVKEDKRNLYLAKEGCEN